jgi:uncharacterized protein (DUF2252 family)
MSPTPGTGGHGSRQARLDQQTPRLSAPERAARGKAARDAVPRQSHAQFEPARDRPDTVSLLEQQAASRVADLLPIRYGRMLASAFAYFRGAALPMASDLAGTPATGLIVQACGDAHLANFGIFASPERRLVFDVNDFDETLPAPWEWDIKRLAASIEVAGQGSGFSRGQRRAAVLAAVAQYRQAMRSYAGIGHLDVWYAHVELDELGAQYQALLNAQERKLEAADLASAQDKDGRQALSKLTRMVHGQPKIVSNPPLVVPLADLAAAEIRGGFEPQLDQIIANYERTLQSDRGYLVDHFEVTDIARKVVGVGSVGMRCWIILLVGRDASDLLLLQLKEADASALSAFAGASAYANQGQRVVAGQQLMQSASDIFLGWHRTEPGDTEPGAAFYVRQLRDWKFSLVIEGMSPVTMRAYGELCGRTLARAHARSGDRIAIAAYLGGSDVFDQAIADFAAAYARQNERDFASLGAAAASGRITAERGI